MTASVPAGTVYKSMGRADVILKLQVPWLVLLVGSVLLFIDEGIVAVAACQAAVATVFALLQVIFVARRLAVGAGVIWRALWPPLMATGAMAAVLLVFREATLGPWLMLCLGTTLGGVVYVASLGALAPDLFRKLYSVAYSDLRRADHRNGADLH